MEKQFKKNRGRALSVLTAILIAFTLVTGLVPQAAAEPAYAAALNADAMKIINVGARGIMQGGEAEVVMRLENLKDEPIVFDETELKFVDARGIEVTPANLGKVTLEKGGKADIRFTLKIGKMYDTGVTSYYFTLKNAGEVIFTSAYYEIEVLKFTSTGDDGTNFVNGIDMNYEISPAEGFAKGGDNFLRFHVFNVGNNRIKNTVIALTMPEGIGINNGSDSYNIGYISSGDDKYGEFNIFVGDQVYTDNYKFTATVTGTDQGGNAVTFTKNFYIQVKGKDKKDEDEEEEEDKDGEKNPRLMVSNYSIGANSVLAGSSFNLALDIKNTSSKKLENAKVSVTSDGTFVPVGGSNSFFIESVEPGATVAKTLKLNVIPEAEQKTTAITVHIEYEDTKGNALTSDDTIAVKVNQKTRLVVDDIVPPMEIFVGNGTSATVDFYNMGKTVLSNLRVQAEGNFDVYESNSYFAGNMASGAKDSYSFNFIPREVGPVEGTITFTYDDVEGNPQSMQTTFSFEATEMPNYEEEMGGMDMPMEPEKTVPKSLWIAGIVLLALIIGLIIFNKIRKHRFNKRLELEDAAFEAAMSGNTGGNGNNNNNTGADGKK